MDFNSIVQRYFLALESYQPYIERDGLVITSHADAYVKGYRECPIYDPYFRWRGPDNEWREIFVRVLKKMEEELPIMEAKKKKTEKEKYSNLPKPKKQGM